MNGNLKVIGTFSDGAAQHFKQKFTFVRSTTLHKDNVQINWHFFATSPGKGAVGGIGGAAQWPVQTAIMICLFHVSTALKYSECAKMIMNMFDVIDLPAEHITLQKE